MDPDPNPAPDLNPFFSDFKDATKNFSFFLMTYLQAYYLQSQKIYFLLKFCVKTLSGILQALFSDRSTPL
jgi:hypothetical protein